MALVAGEEDGVFLRRPLADVDARVQIFAPTLLALLGVAARHSPGDRAPASRAVLLDRGTEEVVFLWRPLPFHEVGPERLPPPLVALSEVSRADKLGNGFPVLRPVDADSLHEAVVFLLRPVTSPCGAAHFRRLARVPPGAV